MRKILSIVMTAAFLLPALPVAADPPPWAPAHGRRAEEAEREYRRNGTTSAFITRTITAIMNGAACAMKKWSIAAMMGVIIATVPTAPPA